MIQYKVYIIEGSEAHSDGVIKKLVESDGFGWYDNMDEAFEDIRKRGGDSYVEYTVLPVLKRY